MIIREGQLKDIDEILGILKSTSELQGMNEGKEPLYSKEFVKDYVSDKKMNLVLVAEENRKLVGFILAEIWLKKKYSFLADIFVSNEFRGKGVGKKLFEAYEQYCKKKYIKIIIGLVKIKNKNMHKFCKKAGFKRGDTFYYYEKNI